MPPYTTDREVAEDGVRKLNGGCSITYPVSILFMQNLKIENRLETDSPYQTQLALSNIKILRESVQYHIIDQHQPPTFTKNPRYSKAQSPSSCAHMIPVLSVFYLARFPFIFSPRHVVLPTFTYVRVQVQVRSEQQ